MEANLQLKMTKKESIGGQAIIEGVMIRNQKNYAVAIRKKNKIITKKVRIKQRKSKIFKWPVIRGFVNMIEMLTIGMKTLMWSADQQLEKDEKIGKNEMTFSIIISLLFGIGIFIVLPYYATNLIGFYEETRPLLFNFIDGLIRISVFILYVVIISLMKDVRIMFQYHGAEHKAVHCHEKGLKLEIKNIKKFSTLHPRCGTAFLMIVLVFAILTFSLITPLIFTLFPQLLNLHAFPRRLILVLIRLSLLPLIAGLSYEFLKFSAKYEDKPIMKMLIWPGLLMQKITTKEPTKKQIEVAKASIDTLLSSKKAKNI